MTPSHASAIQQITSFAAIDVKSNWIGKNGHAERKPQGRLSVLFYKIIYLLTGTHKYDGIFNAFKRIDAMIKNDPTLLSSEQFCNSLVIFCRNIESIQLREKRADKGLWVSETLRKIESIELRRQHGIALQIAQQQAEQQLSQAYHRQIQTAQQECLVKQQELQTVRNELQTKDQALQTNQQVLQTVRNELQTKDQALQTKDQALQTKDQALQTNQQALQTVRNELQTNQQELQRVRNELQTNQQELQRVRNELQTNQQELQRVRNELQTNQQELQRVRNELQTNQQELQKVQNEPQSKQQEELQTVQKELQNKQQELQTVQKELQNKQQELQTVRNELLKKDQELQKAQKDLQTAKKELQDTQKEYQSEIIELKKSIVNKNKNISSSPYQSPKSNRSSRNQSPLISPKINKSFSSLSDFEQSPKKILLEQQLSVMIKKGVHNEIEQFLENNRVDIDVPDEKGLDILQKAIISGCDSEIIDLLMKYYPEREMAEGFISDYEDMSGSFDELLNDLKTGIKDILSKDDFDSVTNDLLQRFYRQFLSFNSKGLSISSELGVNLTRKLDELKKEQIKLLKLTPEALIEADKDELTRIHIAYQNKDWNFFKIILDPRQEKERVDWDASSLKNLLHFVVRTTILHDTKYVKGEDLMWIYEIPYLLAIRSPSLLESTAPDLHNNFLTPDELIDETMKEELLNLQGRLRSGPKCFAWSKALELEEEKLKDDFFIEHGMELLESISGKEKEIFK